MRCYYHVPRTANRRVIAVFAARVLYTCVGIFIQKKRARVEKISPVVVIVVDAAKPAILRMPRAITILTVIVSWTDARRNNLNIVAITSTVIAANTD